MGHVRGVKLAGAGERWLQPVFERRLRAGASGGNATDWENVVVRFDSGTRVPVDGGSDYLGPRELFVRDRDAIVVERALPAQAFAVADLRGNFAQTTERVATTLDTSGQYSLTDQWSNTVREGAALYTGVDNTWGDSALYSGGGGMTTNGETAAADAFISVWAISKMASIVYGQTVKPTTTRVHFPMKGANSVVEAGGVWTIYVGYADLSAAVKEPLTDIEVVGHEYGHNIIADKTGLLSSTALGEQGGILEGSADIFGMNAGFYMGSALNPFCLYHKVLPPRCTWTRTLSITNDWVFGNRSHFAGALRSFMDPKVDAWSPSITSVEAHEAGGPLRRMYYFLSVGVLGQGPWVMSDDPARPQRHSIFLPQGLTGLGVDVASKIWWHTIDGLYIAASTDYASYRALMLQAATTLYGEHSQQYKAVEDAWAAVNVGQPADRTGPQVDLVFRNEAETRLVHRGHGVRHQRRRQGRVPLLGARCGRREDRGVRDGRALARAPRELAKHRHVYAHAGRD